MNSFYLFMQKLSDIIQISVKLEHKKYAKKALEARAIPEHIMKYYEQEIEAAENLIVIYNAQAHDFLLQYIEEMKGAQ